MAAITLKSLAAAQAETNSNVSDLIAAVAALAVQVTALTEGVAVAKAPVAPAAPRVTQPKVTTTTKVTLLSRKSREAFIAKAAWAKGLSVLEIATEVVEGRRKAPKGFAIGEGYTKRVTTGSF